MNQLLKSISSRKEEIGTLAEITSRSGNENLTDSITAMLIKGRQLANLPTCIRSLVFSGWWRTEDAEVETEISNSVCNGHWTGELQITQLVSSLTLLILDPTQNLADPAQNKAQELLRSLGCHHRWRGERWSYAGNTQYFGVNVNKPAPRISISGLQIAIATHKMGCCS